MAAGYLRQGRNVVYTATPIYRSGAKAPNEILIIMRADSGPVETYRIPNAPQGAQ